MFKTRIKARPDLKLTKRIISKEDYQALHKNVYFFRFGREALLKIFSLSNLNSKFLLYVPAFICSSTFECLDMKKVKIIFYEIDIKLKVDLEKISKIFLE